MLERLKKQLAAIERDRMRAAAQWTELREQLETLRGADVTFAREDIDALNALDLSTRSTSSAPPIGLRG